MTVHIPAALMVAFAAVCVVCTTVLIAINRAAPDIFTILAASAISAAAGLSIPGGKWNGQNGPPAPPKA